MPPASATQANTATYPDIAAVIQPRRAAAGSVPPDRSWARQRPIAPRRIGSSMNRHDNAAAAMLAATWTVARARPGAPVPGVVSTMIG